MCIIFRGILEAIFMNDICGVFVVLGNGRQNKMSISASSMVSQGRS